jgi:1A family penicillin-binding protein
MRVPDLKLLTRRQWAIVEAGTVAAVLFLVAATWTVQHAWAIYRLNRGVGDTVFLDASGREWFRLDEQRRDVPLDAVAPYLRDAVVAVEDHRFFMHPGIDLIGMGRAVVHNVRTDGPPQGGSTITQQLARTLFLSNARTSWRKAKEAVLAGLLEIFLSKAEILELYLNRVYITTGLYGVETVSQKLFGKPAARLTLGESALVAGIIRGPVAYSPWSNVDASRRRSFVVLQRMREEGMITPAQEQAARDERIRILPRPSVTNARHGYAKELLRAEFRRTFGAEHPPDWTVRTTFNRAVQEAAEAAVRDGLRGLGQRGLQAALVAMHPATGDLLAVVGGADFATTPFNRATRSRRQPGSAFKPLVYAVALERGMSPVSTIGGLRQVAVQAPEGVWIPADERAAADALTIREALLESNNAAAVRIQQDLGTWRVVRFARDVGVRDQPEVPSLALGSGLVTPLELASAYTTFPGLGYRAHPRSIVSVENARGDTVQRVDIRRDRVLSPETAFQMFSMLQDVVNRGTAARARRLGVAGPVGGKTGTTNEYRDAWFVGVSSSVVVAVWVGYDEPRRIREGGTGARVALPIWADFMRRTARILPSQRVAAPSGMQPRELCAISYQRPVDTCPTYIEHFKHGDAEPRTLCRIHQGSLKQQAQRAVEGALSAIGRRILDVFR